ncbi:hypothetical protein [Rickettsia asembonensis]|uniref:hypothetical protein n=1 Tax=Rickettsia asembonensis TaxID=1068590 RepID=UPI000AE04446|nr:hypothetical protein [Rickettsia asembonensis]
MSFPRGVVAWTGKTQCVTPWSSHGMTKVKLVHATMLSRVGGNLVIKKYKCTKF